MQEIILNMVPGGALPAVRVSQYDVGREILCKLMDGKNNYSIPSGASVTVQGTKKDGAAFVYDCAYSGSTVTVTTTRQMCAVIGRVFCELRITSGSNDIGSMNFIIQVEPAGISDDTVISQTEGLDTLTAGAFEAADKAVASQAAAANSATAAAASQSAAKTSETNAAKSATAAANSATSAANSASSASTSANNSANSATAAANSATAAAASAQTAASIAGVGEFSYYISDEDNMLHFKYKQGGLS